MGAYFSKKNHSLYFRCRSQCKIFVKFFIVVYPTSQVMTVKERNHAWDLKNSSHHLFLCLLKSQNSFYHTPTNQLPACLHTNSAYVKHYYQLWRWSEYNDMSFFKDKMTTWQKSKTSTSRTQILCIKHWHKSEKLVPKHIKMNWLK
jgi:hypothetical protein